MYDKVVYCLSFLGNKAYIQEFITGIYFQYYLKVFCMDLEIFLTLLL